MSYIDYDDWASDGFEYNQRVIELYVGYDENRPMIQFDKFENLPKLQKLTLNEHTLLSIPSNAFDDLPNLRFLDLKDNGLTTLPESISSLKKLEYLYLNNNNFTVLPEWITKLKNLLVLDVTSNLLTSLPQDIGSLSELITLYASDNQITALPESIKKLKNLRVLDVTSNLLTSLPESIGEIKNILEIILEDNPITALPESIGNLSKLERIYLIDSQLDELPESITKLNNLRIFRISNSNKKIKVTESVYAFIKSNFPSKINDFEIKQPNVKLPSTIKMKGDLKHIGSPSKIEIFDPILMEPDLKMNTYLKEDPDNMIVISGNSHYALTKDTIRMQIGNTSNIVFECIQPNTLREENIVRSAKYLRCNSLGLPGDFIDLKLIELVLQSKHQIYEIKKTSKKLSSVVSDAVLNYNGSHVSASHCQEGQGGNVYEFIRIFGVNKTSKSRKIRSLYRSESRKSHKSTHTNKKRNSKSKKMKISSSI